MVPALPPSRLRLASPCTLLCSVHCCCCDSSDGGRAQVVVQSTVQSVTLLAVIVIRPMLYHLATVPGNPVVKKIRFPTEISIYLGNDMR